MDTFSKFCDLWNNSIISLPDEELQEVISAVEKDSDDISDEIWEKYHKLAAHYIEPYESNEEMADMLDNHDISKLLEAICESSDLVEAFSRLGILDNASDAQIKFCKLVDRIGY